MGHLPINFLAVGDLPPGDGIPQAAEPQHSAGLRGGGLQLPKPTLIAGHPEIVAGPWNHLTIKCLKCGGI
jgi:hypothetical protein